jgi:hypothetical protein
MDEHKRAHMDVSSQSFQRSAAEGADESWFHHFIPEKKNGITWNGIMLHLQMSRRPDAYPWLE